MNAIVARTKQRREVLSEFSAASIAPLKDASLRLSDYTTKYRSAYEKGFHHFLNEASIADERRHAAGLAVLETAIGGAIGLLAPGALALSAFARDTASSALSAGLGEKVFEEGVEAALALGVSRMAGLEKRQTSEWSALASGSIKNPTTFLDMALKMTNDLVQSVPDLGDQEHLLRDAAELGSKGDPSDEEFMESMRAVDRFGQSTVADARRNVAPAFDGMLAQFSNIPSQSEGLVLRDLWLRWFAEASIDEVEHLEVREGVEAAGLGYLLFEGVSGVLTGTYAGGGMRDDDANRFRMNAHVAYLADHGVNVPTRRPLRGGGTRAIPPRTIRHMAQYAASLLPLYDIPPGHETQVWGRGGRDSLYFRGKRFRARGAFGNPPDPRLTVLVVGPDPKFSILNDHAEKLRNGTHPNDLPMLPLPYVLVKNTSKRVGVSNR